MEPAARAPLLGRRERQGQLEQRVRAQPVAHLEPRARRVQAARQEPLALLQQGVLPGQQAPQDRRVLEALRGRLAQVVSEEAVRAGQGEPHQPAPTAR